MIKEIEINNYFPDSKFRISTYSGLTINEVDYSDSESMDKLLDTLKRLRTNVLEYGNYLKFVPLFNYFKEKYEKQESVESNNSTLKNIENQINTKESKLDNINGKIFNDHNSSFSLFKKNSAESLKNLKIEYKINLTESNPTTRIPIIIGIAPKNKTPTPLLK